MACSILAPLYRRLDKSADTKSTGDAATKPTARKMKLKGDVPKRSDKPLMGLSSDKNFVCENVKEAAVVSPKHKEQQQVHVWTLRVACLGCLGVGINQLQAALHYT